jgi:hypothetical protein
MGVSYLDKIWRTSGASALRSEFYSVATRGRERAVRYLSDGDTSFPVLFILMPELERLGLYKDLPPRCVHALRLCAKKTSNAKLEDYLTYLIGGGEAIKAPQECLKWMLESGINWDGPSAGRDDYDAVIDLAATLIIADYGDTSMLVAIAELIFERNRRGLFIHDLVWGFFQSIDAGALSALSKYILSGDDSDVNLACELLGLDVPETQADKQTTYYGYTEWLRENRPYLYLTGEHFQATSKPHHLMHDVEAKYLQREITPRERAPLSPLSEDEQMRLGHFRQAGSEEQDLLSKHSKKLHTKDENAWGDWLGMELAEQVMAAKHDDREAV